MQQTGDTGFSMRALADEAGVSIATPYNLFGSKQTIMFAVLDADLEYYQKRLAKVRVDELDVFFKAVSLATSLYSTEPAFLSRGAVRRVQRRRARIPLDVRRPAPRDVERLRAGRGQRRIPVGRRSNPTRSRSISAARFFRPFSNGCRANCRCRNSRRGCNTASRCRCRRWRRRQRRPPARQGDRAAGAPAETVEAEIRARIVKARKQRAIEASASHRSQVSR